MSEQDQHTVIDYAEDADLDDPFQHLCWALTQWIPFGKMQEMPAIRPLAPYQSEFLCKLGIRYHPELATLFKIPDPDPDAQGRAMFVEKDEYEAYLAKGEGDFAEAAATSQAMEMLAKFDPALAEAISSMTPEERAEAARGKEAAAKEALGTLAELRTTLEVKSDDPA